MIGLFLKLHAHWLIQKLKIFGRLFEQMIRSVKQAVNAVLRNADGNEEELQTVFTGVEGLMNSRLVLPN